MPLQQGTLLPQFGVGQLDPMIDPESVQFSHKLRMVGVQPPGGPGLLQVSLRVTDSLLSTQAPGQTTLTMKVKSGPRVVPSALKGGTPAHPGAFVTTSTAKVIPAWPTKKCRSLAVTPVLLVNVAIVPGADVGVGVVVVVGVEVEVSVGVGEGEGVGVAIRVGVGVPWPKKTTMGRARVLLLLESLLSSSARAASQVPLNALTSVAQEAESSKAWSANALIV